MSRVLPAMLTFALCGLAAARADDARAKAIAPFLDDEVVAVLRLDLTKVDLNDLLTRVFQDRDAASVYSEELGPWFAALRKAGAKELLGLIRAHWGIENGLHYVRDVTLGEDASRVRRGSAPEVMATSTMMPRLGRRRGLRAAAAARCQTTCRATQSSTYPRMAAPVAPAAARSGRSART